MWGAGHVPIGLASAMGHGLRPELREWNIFMLIQPWGMGGGDALNVLMYRYGKVTGSTRSSAKRDMHADTGLRLFSCIPLAYLVSRIRLTTRFRNGGAMRRKRRLNARNSST